MTDTFNVTASFDKPSYNVGDTMTVTISGADVITTSVTSNSQVGPLNLTLTANDGATSVLTVPATVALMTTTETSNDSVIISGVVDLSPTPRVWTVANTGLSATATA